MIENITYIIILLFSFWYFIFFIRRQLNISYCNGYLACLKDCHSRPKVDVNLIQDEVTYNDKKGTFYFIPDEEQK